MSNDISFIENLVKVGQLVQKLKSCGHRQKCHRDTRASATHRQPEVIIYLPSSSMKENRLKTGVKYKIYNNLYTVKYKR